jgi:DegV family protein with EDD domain
MQKMTQEARLFSVRMEEDADTSNRGIRRKGALGTAMDNFVIVTDSTSDLAPDMVRAHDIRIVPLKVVFGGEVMEDGVNCDGQRVFDRVKETGILPTTSAASPGDFANVFAEIAKEGKKALYIGISTDFSSTVQSANIAAGDLPDGSVEIVDSRNLSTGIGILVLKAVKLREEGKSLAETAAAIRAMTGNVRTAFVIETLDYLYKGGRLNALSHMIGSMLKIRPLVQVVDGKMIVGEKIRGSINKGFDVMIKRALADKDRIDPSLVFVTHASAPEAAERIKSALEREMPEADIAVTVAGSVISTHCGPGTAGIIYMVKE